MFKKIIVLGMVFIMCLGILSACKDYGYDYHFSVIGENGTISAEWTNGDKSPLEVIGGKGRHSVVFIATPDDGYKVKEWRLNGEIVEGNKSNSFTAVVKEFVNYITVEFEPIN